ncbi:MAG: serine--tRNA ligase [Acidimicrobiia bacterium]
MLDPALLRDDLARLESGLSRRGLSVDLAGLQDLDRRRRSLRRESEDRRAEQKRVSQEIPNLDGDERESEIEKASALGGEAKRLAAEAEAAAAEFDELWASIPNLPDETAADGATEEDAVEVRRWGDIPDYGFELLDHVELGERLGMIDLGRAAKVSGTRFGYVLGAAVIVEFALVRWALDRLIAEGFTAVVPPVMVREPALFGTGFFPGDRDQVYAIERDDLYLVGTSEVPLAGLHMDEILDAVPVRYVAFSTCFRREAGTYGKDTRGIFRVHQFDKVEMFSFVSPEESATEHERLLGLEEALVQELGIPYRVVNVAAGDLGPAAAKKYDIEAWMPSQGRYREITSCSNTTDYQSRRLKVRFRDEGKNRLVHTLNGTAVAIGRTLIAIMENYQQSDGSIAIPEALQPYVGFDTIEA